jgi:hypothetical protein
MQTPLLTIINAFGEYVRDLLHQGVVCRYDDNRESVSNTEGSQKSKPSQEPPLVDSQHHGYVVDSDSDSESDTCCVLETRPG